MDFKYLRDVEAAEEENCTNTPQLRWNQIANLVLNVGIESFDETLRTVSGTLQRDCRPTPKAQFGAWEKHKKRDKRLGPVSHNRSVHPSLLNKYKVRNQQISRIGRTQSVLKEDTSLNSTADSGISTPPRSSSLIVQNTPANRPNTICGFSEASSWVNKGQGQKVNRRNLRVQSIVSPKTQNTITSILNKFTTSRNPNRILYEQKNQTFYAPRDKDHTEKHQIVSLHLTRHARVRRNVFSSFGCPTPAEEITERTPGQTSENLSKALPGMIIISQHSYYFRHDMNKF